MTEPHIVLLHPKLAFDGSTERTLALARNLHDRGLHVTIVSQSGSRSGAFEEAGISVRAGELPIQPFASPFATWRTKKLLSNLKPDVIHATDAGLAGLSAILAGRLALPYVLEVTRASTRPLAIDPKHLHCAILTSRTLSEATVNRGGIPLERLRVLEHGPHAPFDAPPARFAHPHEVRVGFTGQLDERRGTEVFLEAARQLSLTGRPLRFLFLGEGPDELLLRRRVRELALTEHVTISAPCTSNAAEILLTLDVHVSCNLDGVPGWFAYQALSLGIPSIISAFTSSISLIEDEVSGIFVERGNPEVLAREIANLTDHPERARSMGRAARETMIARDVSGEFEQELREIYNGVLGEALVGLR